MPKKILKGKVISDINEKTVVVLVERKYQHPFLKKIIKKKKNTMLTMKKIYLKLVTPYKLKSQNLIQKINDLKY
jgi:ribosomal protein S17